MAQSELALWRFSLIAPLLHRAPGVSLTAMVRQLALEVKTSPDGAPAFLSAETLLRWLGRYRKGGLAALENQTRSDHGRSRAIDPDTVAKLFELAAEHPAWTLKAVHRRLQLDLARPVPLKPIYRLFKGRKRLEPAEAFRRRPPGVPQVLWLADTMHGPEVYGPGRKKRKSFLIAFLDDASRAVMAGAFSLRDNVLALMPVLREAILARGLPHRLLVDNGANYRSLVLRSACARLGIHLVHATPYRATSKARLERFWLTVRLQMLTRLPQHPTLQQLQTEWARWLAEYHDTPHSSLTEITGKPTTPLDFYLRLLPDNVRHLGELAIDDLFLIEAPRRVNADATVRVAAKFWEVRAQLAGSRVLVRFNPDDPRRVLYRPLHDPNAPFEQAFQVQ
ncbi:MAG: DDE-type integrase/transposase/recombinase [Candidatus Tectomicrobia bacterium]|nr:DDE-type integrase/transposase/recombinase [Candidatus Tectomicrobia bacterium]